MAAALKTGRFQPQGQVVEVGRNNCEIVRLHLAVDRAAKATLSQQDHIQLQRAADGVAELAEGKTGRGVQTHFYFGTPEKCKIPAIQLV
ncbi:hypothetical protein [Synechococcus sp. 1G10]|uniref:hypothetical protein n=1 Tax=Synechococcus sp. 1G10 TaxID=2025605 RepID=UPI00117E42FE|nr:hypothetical protein [Synechococcus sp. 1G10]